MMLPAVLALAAASLDARIDAAAARFMADRCHVGLSIVVRHAGRDHFHNYGAVRRGGAPPSATTVYELASVTKSFTGALAARALVERRMSLDGDFRAWLPGRYPGLARDGRSVTLRALATHTAGMPRDIPDSDDLFAHPDPDRIGPALNARTRGVTRARFLAALATTRLRSTPGATFTYSNAGIRLLGEGLAAIYRTTYPVLLDRALLRPLGMADTGLRLRPDMAARLATPYTRTGHIPPYHDATAGAAWGLYSTPRDMARYLRWQLDERDPVVARAHALIRGSSVDGQGLIWSIGRDRGQRMLWHGGGSFGMTSQILLFPDRVDGAVLLANDACAGSESALKTLAVGIERALAASPPLAHRPGR